MTNERSYSPRWETSSFGHPADAYSLERTALSDHLGLCAALRGPLQSLQNGAATIQGLLAGHVITSLLVVLLLAGGAWQLH